jgi:hypothetical protein
VARKPVRRSDQRDREIKRALLQRRLNLARSRGLSPNPTRVLELRAEIEKLAAADRPIVRLQVLWTLALVLLALSLAAWLMWK